MIPRGTFYVCNCSVECVKSMLRAVVIDVPFIFAIAAFSPAFWDMKPDVSWRASARVSYQ